MTLELVMDRPLAKVIEFLLENPVMDYSKTDLAEEKKEEFKRKMKKIRGRGRGGEERGDRSYVG